MTKLRLFFGACLLVASLSGVAAAGETQGPPAPAPPPSGNCVTEYPGNDASAPAQPAQDWSVDVVTAADVLAAWLVATIQ